MMIKQFLFAFVLFISFETEVMAFSCGCAAPASPSYGDEACTVEVTYQGSSDCCQAWGPVGGADFSVLDCFGEELYNFQDTGSGGVAFCTSVGSISC